MVCEDGLLCTENFCFDYPKEKLSVLVQDARVKDRFTLEDLLLLRLCSVVSNAQTFSDGWLEYRFSHAQVGTLLWITTVCIANDASTNALRCVDMPTGNWLRGPKSNCRMNKCQREWRGSWQPHYDSDRTGWSQQKMKRDGIGSTTVYTVDNSEYGWSQASSRCVRRIPRIMFVDDSVAMEASCHAFV